MQLQRGRMVGEQTGKPKQGKWLKNDRQRKMVYSLEIYMKDRRK
jgi:hypothetical protein